VTSSLGGSHSKSKKRPKVDAEHIRGSLTTIQEVARHTAVDANATQAATGELAALVGELQGLVERTLICSKSPVCNARNSN
jgi:hydroxymethylglutaryl-CoA reductase